MSETFQTPVLLLIFNRPDITREVFEQVRKIKPAYLFVAADGPRTHRPDELALCDSTKEIFKSIDWDCELKTLYRKENLGCGPAVSGGISWFFEQVEYGIILEDDCLPEASFFPYCEELLIKYKTDEQVMSIGGSTFQQVNSPQEASYYFSQYPHIWGWATWRRAWLTYDFNMNGLDAFNEKGINAVFKNFNERRFWKNLFLKVKTGKINTWDYQWLFAMWKNGGYAITPAVNLIINLGFKNASTHAFLNDSYIETTTYKSMSFPLHHPEKKINEKADRDTFKNVYGHTLKRMTRLLLQNQLLHIIKHYFKISVL